MDIKKALLEIINSESNLRNSYIGIEKIILTMLEDYLHKQNKVLENFNRNFGFDALIPGGIDDMVGNVAVEIKLYRNGFPLRLIYNTVGKISMRGGEIDTLLLIIVNELSEEIKQRVYEEQKNLNFTLKIWDINDLVKIFEKNDTLFIEIYNNINRVLFNDTISRGISRNSETYHEKRNKYILQLNQEYINDNIVLFLGAGASKDAKIATWNTLISDLFVALIDKQLSGKNIEMAKTDKEKISKEITKQNGNSPLLQTRFLRSSFDDDFEELVREILYKNAIETSEILEEIGRLCVPDRGKFGIQAIINYNFDDLVEKNLKRLRIKYLSVYGEGMVPCKGELGVFHVHGFLPQDKNGYDNLAKSLLVFSEEGYHKLLLEPYNWANITQLNYLINNTCVFIGLSMTDPNMRRLLEIAARKSSDDEDFCKHYAILLRLNIKDGEGIEAIKNFEKVNESLQEAFFREMGVNIIWVDEYSEIPELLRHIKGSYDRF